LQIFGHFSFVQKLLKIILNVPILACERYVFVSQKDTFGMLKGHLSHSQRIAFAKPEVKTGIFNSIF